MIKKLAEAIQMSFEVPKVEREMAIAVVKHFEHVEVILDNANNHLDVLYNPFKKHPNISSDLLHEKRGLLNRFVQQSKDNFEEVKRRSLLAIQKISYFDSDTAIYDMMEAFRNSIQELEKLIVEVYDLLEDYRAEDFVSKLITAIDSVRTQIVEVENLIKDRIIDYIDTNILVKNWMTDKGEELNLSIQQKTPAMVSLFEEQRKALE